MILPNRKGLALAVSAMVTGCMLPVGLNGPLTARAVEPLYVLGPKGAVAKALGGQHVRACAPAVVSLPKNFEHLRTPQDQTGRAVALGICEVMVVAGGDVAGAKRALSGLDVAVAAAPLGDTAVASSGASRAGEGRVILASTGPADQVAASSSDQAEGLFYQGYEALQANRVDESIDLFERGLRLSPTNHMALYFLGQAYEAADQPARARTLYQRVVKLAPDSTEASQARVRLEALGTSSASAGSSGRFSTGIFIDPAAPPEDRSIRDVFEKSPMAAGDRAPSAEGGAELPPPPLPPLQSRSASRIQAPSVPAMTEPAVRPSAKPEMARPQTTEVAQSPAATTAPSEKAGNAVPAARSRRSSGMEGGGIGTGRLSTRLGAGRVPSAEGVEVGSVETTAPGPGAQPASPQGTMAAESAPGLPWAGEGREVQEARLTTPRSEAEVSSAHDSARVDLGRGATYAGAVVDGKPDGEGRITYTDGSTYEGAFEAGERRGKGVFVSAEGWRYEGDFRNGRFDGQGTLTYANGATYAGAFEGGERTGTGTYTWPSGARYQGAFENGVIVGPGVYTAADGTRYDGEFAEGRRTGEGTLTLPDGRIYVGNLANGVPQGRGSFYWPDGRRFAGEFSNGAAAGAGTLVYPDGRTESGTWTSRSLMAGLERVSR